MSTTKTPVKKFHTRHPLRFRKGAHKGKFPHQLSASAFLSWQILQGMTEDDYWLAMQAGDRFAEELSRYGKPIKTAHLSPDQRGWAQAQFGGHFVNEDAKWFIREEKPSRPIPAHYNLLRRRRFDDECSCDSPEYKEWGVRYDNVPLVQCDNCGEVVEAEWENDE